MRLLIIKKHNLYLLFFGMLFMLYTLNDLASYGSVKIFYLLIPLILLACFFINKIPNSQIFKITFLLILFALVSQAHSVLFSPVNSDYILYANIRYVLVLLIIIPLFVMYPKNSRLFDFFMLCSACVLVVSSYFCFFYSYNYMGRFSGTFSNPNDFSLLIIFLIYYLLYLRDIRKPTKIIIYVLVFLIIALSLLVMLTLSRSGIIILFVLFTFYFVSLISRVNFFYKILIFIMVSIILFVLINVFDSDFVRVLNRFVSDEGTSSTHKRFLQINAAINLLGSSDYNWLFGMGMSATGSVDWFRGYYPFGYSEGYVYVVHNTYLAVLIHHGLVGFSLYMFFMIAILHKIFRLRHYFKYTMLGYFIAATLFSQAAYTIYFLPYWLGFIMLALHADNLKVCNK